MTRSAWVFAWGFMGAVYIFIIGMFAILFADTPTKIQAAYIAAWAGVIGVVCFAIWFFIYQYNFTKGVKHNCGCIEYHNYVDRSNCPDLTHHARATR